MTRALLYFIALMLMDHVGMPAWAIVTVIIIGILHVLAALLIEVAAGMNQS